VLSSHPRSAVVTATEVGGPHPAEMSSTQETDNPAGQQIATRDGVGLLDTLMPEIVRSGTGCVGPAVVLCAARRLLARPQ
jgi:hypothetical protein